MTGPCKRQALAESRRSGVGASQCMKGCTSEASRRCLMDHTMGKSTAQQQTMSTRCRMSRQVIQLRLAGVASSKITIATSAQICAAGCIRSSWAGELQKQGGY